MNIIIDTNIIFSATLPSGETLRDIISKEEYTCLTCNFAIGEIFKHKQKIIKASRNSEEEVLQLFFKIIKDIHFINEKVITEDNKRKAYNLCKDIDSKDIPFVV